MFEWCDTAGTVLRTFDNEDEAMDYFEDLSVLGDYLWDTNKQAVVIANVEKLIEEL